MLLATKSQARIKILVMPTEVERAAPATVAEIEELIDTVLSQLPEVILVERKDYDRSTASKAGKILRRCRKELDCQIKLGNLLNANAVVSTRIDQFNSGLQLEITVLDVGSGEYLAKISRTLSGSKVRKAAVLEALFVAVFFPERVVGAIDLFLNPPGGQIFLDGKLKTKNTGPQLHLKDIPAGQHTLRVVREGYNDFYAIIQVPYQGTAKIKVKMKEAQDGLAKKTGQIVERPIVSCDHPRQWYEKWWIWTIAGTVLIGSTVTTVLLVK
jgi:hypothetical protein